MKKISAIKIDQKHTCEFCNRSFVRESTIFSHLCEQKHRWQNLDQASSRIAYSAWQEFYKKNTPTKKTKTPLDFVKSPYYTAFIKYGNYCVESKVLNPPRYYEWLIKHGVKIDNWTSDSKYTEYLIQYLRNENCVDAVQRGIRKTHELATDENVHGRDYFRYGNVNKICHNITTGNISPWMLYQSSSGQKFLDNLRQDQLEMLFDYIDPKLWALKFSREPENVEQVKGMLNEAGY